MIKWPTDQIIFNFALVFDKIVQCRLKSLLSIVLHCTVYQICCTTWGLVWELASGVWRPVTAQILILLWVGAAAPVLVSGNSCVSRITCHHTNVSHASCLHNINSPLCVCSYICSQNIYIMMGGSSPGLMQLLCVQSHMSPHVQCVSCFMFA